MLKLHNAGTLAGAALLGLMLLGCGSSVPKDAIRVFQDPNATSNDKLAALDAANRQAQANPAQAALLQESLQKILWDTSQPPALRRAVATQLLRDTPDAQIGDIATQFATLVAREPDPQLIALAAEWAAKHQRTEFVGPLVRAAAFTPASSDAVVTALEKLSGTDDLAHVLLGQVLDPTIPESQKASTLDYERRVQSDAWTLLSRIDPNGTQRPALLASASTANPKGAAILEALRTTAQALRVMPDTGEELQWLLAIHTKNDQAWIQSVRAAVAEIPASPSSQTLALRHLEPVRWAARNKPEWCRSLREELLSIARERLSSRDVRTRPWKQPVKPYREQLEANAPAMRWGDVLTLLVLDEATRTASNLNVLRDQLRIDRDDRTTEFGGLLMSLDDSTRPQFVLYPPRSAQRRSDVEFVASDEMITDAQARPGVLAHYHFHAQEDQNDDNAGPSEGDLFYANRFGAACLVLTSVRGGKINVDYYQPGTRSTSIVIDLGTLPLTK